MVRLALTLLLSRGREELEVIIATGTLPGPKLLLTGNIHGNEKRSDIIENREIEEKHIIIQKREETAPTIDDGEREEGTYKG